MTKKVTIVGSGLTGPLLSILLAKKYNIDVEMYERNPDFRKTDSYSGRSINLALSERGIRALKEAEVYNSEFQKILIPMHGRIIHHIDGNESFQPYSNKKNHFINSVSRLEINKILLDKAEATNKVNINFSMKCDDINFSENYLSINQEKVPFNAPVFGADGYRSIIAKKVAQNISHRDIKHSYKELTIYPKDGNYQMDPNALHIWPRKNMMLIALPNNDKTFTCTLFMKKSGENSFETLNSKEAIFIFFEKNFIDILTLIPDLDDCFIKNPLGKLITTNADTWFYKNQACIIGDAAHAVVPFYGQGMNASFEDCSKICKIIDVENDWESVFKNFSQHRKKDTDAISELALKNYDTMKKDVLDKEYLKKHNLGFELYDMFPDYFIPEYIMVSFTNIPYDTVKKRSYIQDIILKEILSYKKFPKKEVLSRIIKKNLIKLKDEKNS